MSLNDAVAESTAPARRGLELRKAQPVLVGGLPTVSLLPRELLTQARLQSVRRLMIIAVIATVVVAGGATAGAAALASSAQSRLDAANVKTQQLLAQVARFKDVQALQQDIAVAKAGVAVATSTEIDWQAQMNQITADMPSGYTVTSIQADSATPITEYGQGTTPLERPRAATVQMAVSTSDITTLPPWLRKLRSIPAYADATASVSSDSDSGYVVQLVIHLSPKALVATQKGAK